MGEKASMGTAGHELIELRQLVGLQESYEQIDVVAQKYGLNEIHTAMLAKAIRTFQWVPPANAQHELPLALHRDWTVTRIAGDKAAPGNYEVADDVWLSGTLDMAWVHDKTLWVTDLKFGQDRYVEPIGRNYQLWNEAFLAAEYYKSKGLEFESYMPAIIYVTMKDPEGVWDVAQDVVMLGSEEHEEERKRLATLLAKLDSLKAAAAAGKPLWGHLAGEHCQWCPCAHACPAYAGMVRHLITLGERFKESVQDPSVALSRGEIVEAARMRGILTRTSESIDKVLRAVASNAGPIELEEHLALGYQDNEKDEWVASQKAVDKLVEHLGEDRAWAGVEIRKTAVKESIRQLSKVNGQTQKAILATVEAGLKAVGAVETRIAKTFGTFRTD